MQDPKDFPDSAHLKRNFFKLYTWIAVLKFDWWKICKYWSSGFNTAIVFVWYFTPFLYFYRFWSDSKREKVFTETRIREKREVRGTRDLIPAKKIFIRTFKWIISYFLEILIDWRPWLLHCFIIWLLTVCHVAKVQLTFTFNKIYLFQLLNFYTRRA